ncbi:hypothetical protein [Gorillibacterium massiliense]|uniref:hypothetical protein n=1 Tax=Gorillibacterium massiliense TaxID=1280390 RepID=UPI0004B46FC2|nr:hypothetical protein [Gorillibacterium massiliense]
MNKQLNRSDYIFALVVIFFMVCVVASFFFGYNKGTAHVEAKYASELKKSISTDYTGAYDESQLVSYYHNVYAPWLSFQQNWVQDLELLQGSSAKDGASGSLKDLSSEAAAAYASIRSAAISDSSPLLSEAQTNVLKSLTLFDKETRRYLSDNKGKKDADLLAGLDKDAGLNEAKRFALEAQKQYFMAVVKWHKQLHPELANQDLIGSDKLTIAKWKEFPLNAKIAHSSTVIENRSLFKGYSPQDLTARIDSMIASGSATKMKLTTVRSVIDVLLDTGAVRSGDFRDEGQRYSGEVLPHLPIYASTN